MSVEFVDTNLLVYAHDGGAGMKHRRSVELLEKLVVSRSGAISIQVLSEFYSAATRKLGMPHAEAEEVLVDLAEWMIHSPEHADLLRAARLQRKYKLSWWDALIVNSAIELDCSTLWTEDLNDGQRFGGVTVRNPFH